MIATRTRKSSTPKPSPTARYLAAVQQAREALADLVAEHAGRDCEDGCPCEVAEGLRFMLTVAFSMVDSNSSLADSDAAEALVAAAR